MEDLKKKYSPMENVLISINSKVIALPKNEKGRNTKILDQVTNIMIKMMKQKDSLFEGMYKETFYGGSYYDKLKVGKPNEYDLDLVLDIPVTISPCVKYSDQPAFVYVVIREYAKMLTRPEVERKKFEKIDLLLDKENYWSTTKVLKWMESVITSGLKAMKKETNEIYVDVLLEENNKIRIYVQLSKGAPAFKMKLSGTDIDGSNIQLDIDLVPCFRFYQDNWPTSTRGYRSNPSTLKKQFLVVPKTPKGETFEKLPTKERYWRLSFQEQERELFNKDLTNFKPSLRLLKKLKDKYKHQVASYFIKTIFLWTLEEEEDSFWCQPLSVVFMSMLKKYAERVREKNIPYYWHSGYNLIGYLKDSTKTGVANALQKMIVRVEWNLNPPLIHPLIIGEFLLLPEEFEKLKEEVRLAKKFETINSAATSNIILNGSPTIDTTDSKSNNSPPLVEKLNFLAADVEAIWQFSNSCEERKKQEREELMAQINNKFNEFPQGNDVLRYLKNIDEKMDKMFERFDKSEENNQNIYSKLASLEEQVKQLQLENTSLANMIKESETVDSIDTMLNVRDQELEP